LKTSKLHF